MSPSLASLWGHITPRRRAHFGQLLVLMVIASFAEVMSIGAIVPFLGALMTPDAVFAHPWVNPLARLAGITEAKGLLLPITLLFAAASIVAGAMRLALLYVLSRLSHGIGADLSQDLYRKTLYQPYIQHISRNSGDIIAAISKKIESVVYQTIIPILNIISSVFIVAAIVAALIAIDPTIALTAFLGFGSIYGIILLLSRRQLARDGERVSVEQNRVVKAVQEGLGGIRDVLIDGTQETYLKAYRDADIPMRRSQANIQIIAGSPRFAIEALGMVFIAMLAYALAGRPEGMAGSISVLGALAIGAQRLLPVLQLIFISWASLKAGEASLNDIIVLLDQPMPEEAIAAPAAPMTFSNTLEFRDVSFRYASDGPTVVDRLNLIIPRGSSVGLIGTTGSGKSTLLDILMGLLPPSDGDLLVDGVVVNGKTVRAWQHHVAHVPQSIFLTDSTIAENIALGVPRGQIDMELVRQAAAAAQIAAGIESWDRGYDTAVGERGIRLSGGQRQRIGIARALYKKAEVLVLDEATSALDGNTEDAVMSAIEALGTNPTVIMVAHRLSTLRHCSKVIEIVDGRIARAGSYNDIVDGPSALTQKIES